MAKNKELNMTSMSNNNQKNPIKEKDSNMHTPGKSLNPIDVSSKKRKRDGAYYQEQT